jgi:hypothetical protein
VQLLNGFMIEANITLINKSNAVVDVTKIVVVLRASIDYQVN